MKKKSTKKTKKTAKKKIAKKAVKKKTTQKKKTAAKKKVTKKTAIKKKAATKKTAFKTKSTPKKKVAKKKPSTRKEATTTTEKKAAVTKVAKKKAPEKVTAVKKKAAVKKKVTAKKKTAAKEKIAPKKKKSTHIRPASMKKTAAPATIQPPDREIQATSEEMGHPPAAAGSKVTLMVVDPYKLFVFWDINEEELNSVINNGEGYISLLRAYIYEGDTQSGFFDIKAEALSDEIYLDVIPNRGYRIHFGVLKGGSFHTIAASRIKCTPAFGVEDEDMTPEIYEMLIEQMPTPEERISS